MPKSLDESELHMLKYLLSMKRAGSRVIEVNLGHASRSLGVEVKTLRKLIESLSSKGLIKIEEEALTDSEISQENIETLNVEFLTGEMVEVEYDRRYLSLVKGLFRKRVEFPLSLTRLLSLLHNVEKTCRLYQDLSGLAVEGEYGKFLNEITAYLMRILTMRLKVLNEYLSYVLDRVKAMDPDKPDSRKRALSYIVPLIREIYPNSVIRVRHHAPEIRNEIAKIDEEIKTLTEVISVKRTILKEPEESWAADLKKVKELQLRKTELMRKISIDIWIILENGFNREKFVKDFIRWMFGQQNIPEDFNNQKRLISLIEEASDKLSSIIGCISRFKVKLR